MIVGELRRGRGRGLGTDGWAPRPPRGRGGGQRLGVAGELAGGDAGDEALDLREIARLAAGPTPVWAGLSTATRPGARVATAAVTTVLPTSVPVPVTTRIIGRRTPDSTSASTDPAWASSASVSVARAVSRSLLVPFGTDGGRKQPTRTPRSAHAAAAATAMSGSPSTTDTTADGGAGTPVAAARAAAARRIAAGRSGSAFSTRRAASAAPTQAGARPVSKMNERAVSTRCAITAAGPTTAPPWLPRAFDKVTVATMSSAPASPCSASEPAAARPDHPEPVRLVHHQQRAAGAAHRVQLAQRCERAVDGVHAVGDDQRALLGAGGEQRVDGGGVVARGDGDAGAGEPARVDERGVVGRVGDDQRAAGRRAR